MKTSSFFCYLTIRRATVALMFCLILTSCKQLDKLRSSAGGAGKPQTPAVDIGLLGAPTGQPEVAPMASAKTHPSAPKRGMVWQDKNQIKVGYKAGKGIVAMLQIFGFDAKKRAAGNVGGAVMTLQDTPVAIVMYSFSMSGPEVSMCGDYANIILDFSAMKEPMKTFTLGYEQSTEGNNLSEIDLPVDGVKELFISPDYEVFSSQTRESQTDGPFANLSFTTGKSSASAAGSVLVITRNGVEVTRGSLPATGDFSVVLKRVRSSGDVVAWRVEDQSGKVSYQSAFGFPVSGAVPDVVKYTVQIDKHPVPVVKQPAQAAKK